jgi:hypothetical protein
MKKITVIYPLEKAITIAREEDYTLENVFDEFNFGSGREATEFVDSKMRSLSVGDLVMIDGGIHRCEPVGWKRLTVVESLEYIGGIGLTYGELKKADPKATPFYAINLTARWENAACQE